MPENAAMLPENLQVLNGPITDELKTRIANRFLKLHNAYRLRHKCPPLELSEKLCEFAQEWADVSFNKKQTFSYLFKKINY